MRYYPEYEPTEKGTAILQILVENTLRQASGIRMSGFTTVELSKLVGFPVYGATMRHLIGHYINYECYDNKTYYSLFGGNIENLLFFNFITKKEAELLDTKKISWCEIVHEE